MSGARKSDSPEKSNTKSKPFPGPPCCCGTVKTFVRVAVGQRSERLLRVRFFVNSLTFCHEIPLDVFDRIVVRESLFEASVGVKGEGVGARNREVLVDDAAKGGL